MRLRTAVFVAFLSALVSLPSAAIAHHGGPHGQEHVEPKGNGLTVEVGLQQSGAPSGGEEAATPVAIPGGIMHTQSVCALGGNSTCAELKLCDDGSVMMSSWITYPHDPPSATSYFCPSESQDVAAPPEVTPGLVLRALRRVPLPASELVVQPPGGRTLVNFETNFYTEQGEFTRVVHLLGRRVELSIWPESFVWRYGDGSSERTSSAGAPYPDLEITHRYLERGRVAVSVDTTYAAEFRVDGGPWRPVVGTVTIPGESESLRVVTARPVLVGG